MKVLNLRCAHQHDFEGWFASEEDYQSQLARALVECPLCGDKSIAKMPSAPRLNLGGGQEHVGGQAVDLEGERGVMGSRSLGPLRWGGGEDDQVLRGQTPGVVVQVGLDTSDDGRPVVGHEERAAHGGESTVVPGPVPPDRRRQWRGLGVRLAGEAGG